jgi:hypothetical protein
VVACKKAKVHEELLVGICKGVATKGNGLGIKFKLKKFKVGSSKIGVVVRAKKVARPLEWRS